MIVQAYRAHTSTGEWLRLVDHTGMAFGESPDAAARKLKLTGQRLPDGWESTSYGVPIIPEPIPKPLPEVWVNIYPTGNAYVHWAVESAEAHPGHDRLARIHVWTDEDGNDHAEVERV